MNIQDALEMFLVQLRADGRSAHTIAQYRRHVRALGDRDIVAVKPEDIATHVVAVSGGRMPTTVNAVRTSLRMFFAHAQAAGWCGQNPARLLRRALCAPGPPRAMAEADKDRLLATLAAATGDAARRDHMLVMLLAATGVRIGSAVALDAADVDLARGELNLRTMKGGRRARVPLTRALAAALATHIDNVGPGPLFRGRGGRRISVRHAQRRFAICARRAGVAAGGPHALRHAFALRVLEKTHDLRLVQMAMCHASPASTAVYTTVPEARLRAAVEA